MGVLRSVVDQIEHLVLAFLVVDQLSPVIVSQAHVGPLFSLPSP